MKLKPPVKLKVGAEPKKVAALAALLAIAVVVYYVNDSPPPSTPHPQTASRTLPQEPADAIPVAHGPNIARDRAPVPGSRTSGSRSLKEFHPTLKRSAEDAVDYTKIDPTLQLDLLKKLQNVGLEGGTRSLFEFGAAAPPALSEIAKGLKPLKVGPLSPGLIATKAGDPAAKPGEPVKPPPAPIPLKFYGFVNPVVQGPKRAFFLEGDDIFVAGEGDTIKNKYKVIRIGVNSAVVEDTADKNQQTLKLVEEAVG